MILAGTSEGKDGDIVWDSEHTLKVDITRAEHCVAYVSHHLCALYRNQYIPPAALASAFGAMVGHRSNTVACLVESGGLLSS